MNSNDITVTEGRLKQSIDDAVTRSIGNKISQQITNAVENERVKTGVITKFYQFLDKVEIKIDDSEDTVICRILHRFGGELIDFYTPTGEDSFCDNLKEPCIIPRGELHCCILNINDDTDDWLMLGYYNAEELIGINPAAAGNMKIVTRGGTNQFWIKFGYDGLDIRSTTPATMNVGDTDDDMAPVDYANSSNVYTKEEVYNKSEVYTKAEVDELIEQRITEILGEEDNDTTP